MLARSRFVRARDCDDSTDDDSRFNEHLYEGVEDSVVGLLPEPVPEVGEEAVTGCLTPEVASSCYIVVGFQPEG